MSYNQKLYQWYKECEQVIQKNNANILKKQKIAAAASAVVALASETSKEKRRYRKKRIWISELFQRRRLHGFFHATLPVLKLEDLRFQNYFRMNTSQFEELLQLIAPQITRLHVIREPLEAEQRLSICLRLKILYIHIYFFLSSLRYSLLKV